MKVHDAEIVISAVQPEQYPNDALPEIALAGRSNVGKSSLINRLIQRKNLARTSSQPGKTQTLNFYRINKEIMFVDLPGYGYAKVSKTQKSQWGKMIERYLLERDRLRLVIHLIDVRHLPTKDDQQMHDWLKANALPTLTIATKADKIPRSKWQKHLKEIRETLTMSNEEELILFSSETGLGRDEVWEQIWKHVNASQ